MILETLLQAQRIAADNQVICDTIASLKKPRSFISYHSRWEPDSLGDDAAWIDVQVNSRMILRTPARFDELQDFLGQLQRSLLDSPLSVWPYISIKDK